LIAIFKLWREKKSTNAKKEVINPKKATRVEKMIAIGGEKGNVNPKKVAIVQEKLSITVRNVIINAKKFLQPKMSAHDYWNCTHYQIITSAN